MKIETVDTKSQSILFLSRTSSMDPADIAKTMGEAFGTLGGFIGRNRIAPAGPPVCIYRSSDKGKMGYDVGFPVSKEALAKAAGEVKAGETPSGKALKATHVGPYAKLRETYGEVEAHMKKSGIPMPSLSWEVYLGDPDKTPEKDLVTEVYLPLA